jgi:hypothetical protein
MSGFPTVGFPYVGALCLNYQYNPVSLSKTVSIRAFDALKGSFSVSFMRQ